MKKIFYSMVLAVFITTGGYADDVHSFTIGTAIASNLYLTYISLGVMGDSYSKEMYDREQTINLISIIVADSKVQKECITKLMQSGNVSESDMVFLRDVVTCYQYMIEEGTSMIGYIGSGDQSHLGRYDSSRQSAWSILSRLLGFDNQQETE